MVASLRPEWTVDSIRRSEHGTDLVAVLDVSTSSGRSDVVLKATTADFVAPAIARSEPRLLDLVGRETAIPVPQVFGFADSHPEYPAPFYLLENVPGENYEGCPADLDDDAREHVVVEAGRNLARLHDLGPLPQVGRVGVNEGELTVLDGEHGPVEDFNGWFQADIEAGLDALADGTYYPDLALEPERFVDLVPALREELGARLAALPEPAPPRYCHWDYGTATASSIRTQARREPSSTGRTCSPRSRRTTSRKPNRTCSTLGPATPQSGLRRSAIRSVMRTRPNGTTGRSRPRSRNASRRTVSNVAWTRWRVSRCGCKTARQRSETNESASIARSSRRFCSYRPRLRFLPPTDSAHSETDLFRRKISLAWKMSLQRRW